MIEKIKPNYTVIQCKYSTNLARRSGKRLDEFIQ